MTSTARAATFLKIASAAGIVQHNCTPGVCDRDLDGGPAMVAGGGG